MKSIHPSIHFVEMHRDCCAVAFVLNGKIDKDAERIYCEIKINVKSTICLRLGIAAKYSVGFYVDFSSSWMSAFELKYEFMVINSRLVTLHLAHTHTRILLMFFSSFFSPIPFHSFLESKHFSWKTVDEKSVELPFGKMKMKYIYVCGIRMLDVCSVP